MFEKMAKLKRLKMFKHIIMFHSVYVFFVRSKV